MRVGPFIQRPSAVVQQRIEEISSQRIRFIIDPLGPSKFRLKPVERANQKETYIVSIGSEQQCSCRDSELCSHIIYIMIRYFGVPQTCDLLWQRYLTESDIDNILNGRVQRRAQQPKRQELYKTKSGKPKVKRMPIGEEDVCPICYDSLSECDRKKIAWCRRGCGGNFHRKCVKAWIESRRATGEATCPICRCPLDIIGINPPVKKPPVDAPPPLSAEEIRDLMNREISSDDYDLLLRLDQPQPQTTPNRNPQLAQRRAVRLVNSHIHTAQNGRKDLLSLHSRIRTQTQTRTRSELPNVPSLGEITSLRIGGSLSEQPLSNIPKDKAVNRVPIQKPFTTKRTDQIRQMQSFEDMRIGAQLERDRIPGEVQRHFHPLPHVKRTYHQPRTQTPEIPLDLAVVSHH